MHPKLLMHIVSWCGTNFAIKVSEWVEEWKGYSNVNQDKFYDALADIKPTTSNSKEKEIQMVLQKKYNCEIEVKTPVGKIDLLTDKYLIEINAVAFSYA